MSTLSNVSITEHISSSGLTPIAIPEAKSSQTGVSVDYTPDPDKKWYVLRVSYGREDLAVDMLLSAGFYVYVAKRYEWQEVNDRPKRTLVSLIPNIIFAYVSPQEADMLVKDNTPLTHPSPCPRLLGVLSFYYDHFSVGVDYRNPPLTIPTGQMYRFIQITSSHDEHVMLVPNAGQVHLKSDDEVEVIAGKFKGVRGKVVRVAGQQRVGIHLQSLAWVTTAYIPTAFLRKL